MKAQNAYFTNWNTVHAGVHATVLVTLLLQAYVAYKLLNASAYETAATLKGTHESQSLRHAVACLQHQGPHIELVESGVNVGAALVCTQRGDHTIFAIIVSSEKSVRSPRFAWRLAYEIGERAEQAGV